MEQEEMNINKWVTHILYALYTYRLQMIYKVISVRKK